MSAAVRDEDKPQEIPALVWPSSAEWKKAKRLWKCVGDTSLGEALS